MKLLSRIKDAKGRAAGYGGCYRCGDTWDWKPNHSTPFGADGRGVFPLCEECWSVLSPAERLPYYEQLWQEWMRQGMGSYEGYDRAEHDAIMDAVRAGL